MRNIDEDRFLLESAKRHQEGEINDDQFEWILGERGYSKDEIAGAIADFHWVHVHTPRIVREWLVPICIASALALLLLFILKK